MGCLALNASFEPLTMLPVRRALRLVIDRKAEILEVDESRVFRSERQEMAAPLVIRLVRYVSVSQRRRPIPCSRRGVFIRDRETCQYCGAQPGRKGLTIDHILPRSKGGTTAWENVVAACYACNHRKGGRTPTEAGMTLRATPAAPKYVAFALLGELERHTVWSKYAT